jgi:hypothetical protein
MSIAVPFRTGASSLAVVQNARQSGPSADRVRTRGTTRVRRGRRYVSLVPFSMIAATPFVMVSPSDILVGMSATSFVATICQLAPGESAHVVGGLRKGHVHRRLHGRRAGGEFENPQRCPPRSPGCRQLAARVARRPRSGRSGTAEHSRAPALQALIFARLSCAHVAVARA